MLQNKIKPDFTYLELALQCLLFWECVHLFLTIECWFHQKSKNEDYVCEQWLCWRLQSSQCPLLLSCRNSSLPKYVDGYIYTICPSLPMFPSVRMVWTPPCPSIPSVVLSHLKFWHILPYWSLFFSAYMCLSTLKHVWQFLFFISLGIFL